MPVEIYATLLDQDTYHGSIRTMYRILGMHVEVRERRAVQGRGRQGRGQPDLAEGESGLGSLEPARLGR